jgi:hypothetical protein
MSNDDKIWRWQWAIAVVTMAIAAAGVIGALATS